MDSREHGRNLLFAKTIRVSRLPPTTCRINDWSNISNKGLPFPTMGHLYDCNKLVFIYHLCFLHSLLPSLCPSHPSPLFPRSSFLSLSQYLCELQTSIYFCNLEERRKLEMLFIPGLSSEEHLFLCVFKFMPVGEKVTRSHSVTVTLLRYFSQSSLQRLQLELGFVVFPPPSTLLRSGGGSGSWHRQERKQERMWRALVLNLDPALAQRAQTIVPYPKVLRRAPKVT